jgi:hypothetical protein
MTANDFRRIALGMDGAIESSHMDHPDFRVGNRIFASLTHDERSGMVALPPDVQQQLVRADPSTFSMVNGAWGLHGATWVHLESVEEEDALGEAMTIAWRTAVAKGPTKPRAKTAGAARTARTATTSTKKSAATKAAPTRTLKELLAPYPREVQALARAARSLMMELLPKVKETVDPTGPYLTYGYAPGYQGVVSYITVNQKGVKLGVAGGASLPDPKKLLQGSGKYNRHVAIRSPAALETTGLRPLIRAALAAWKKAHA